MTFTIRPLTEQDRDATRALGREAFGAPPADWTPPTAYPLPGRHEYGAFAGDALAAKVVSREYHSWWHGSALPTNGIAGVAVAAEHRGKGLLDGLFDVALAEGLAQRGEAVSALFPTAPGIYRRFGYEVVTSLDMVEVPVSALTVIPRVDGVSLRRATTADMEAVRAIYAAWAATANGPLTRRGPSFPATDEEALAEHTGITLAERDGRPVGYASWDRGHGYDESARVEVLDLVALDADAYRALWRMLGTFSSVTGAVHLETSGADVARLALPSAHWKVVTRHPYMLRIHDVAAATTGLRLAPPAWTVPEVRFSVTGDLLGTADGHYVLTVEEGVASCSRSTAASDAPVFSPRGLAMVWSGAHTCADARAAGQLVGGDEDTARDLDLLLGSRRVHVRDYF